MLPRNSVGLLDGNRNSLVELSSSGGVGLVVISFIMAAGGATTARPAGPRYSVFLERSLMAHSIGCGHIETRRVSYMMDRTIDLDLWGDGAADRLPRITITPSGLRLQGTVAEFDRLCLILGGWLRQ